MVPTAHLKAFEPLDAFEAGEQEYWRRYAAAGERGAVAPTVVLSREAGLGRAIATAVAEREHADVIVRGAGVHVCPHRTRLRLLAAVVAFRESIPDDAAPAFLPEEQFDDALAELERLYAEHPRWRNHILQSSWEVPLRWFVLFDGEERRIVRSAGRSTVRYEAGIAAARSRVGTALDVLRAALPSSTVVGLVSDLAGWLEQFDDGSLVVLEYGEVAGLFAPRALRDDHSARDIWSAIRALARGDAERAAAFYGIASERWARVRARESVN